MTHPKPASPPQAWYALAVLLLAYILSFIDRNVMAVLIGPIRADFDISDFQYSLLHGFAFSIFYIVLGLPIARLADRSNRKWIITIGVFFWSVMTCVCGAARSFSMLFLARIGVGVGEAALSPPAFSLLGDMFDADKLPRAISIFSLGITIGGGLAYIIGGFVYEYFANSAAVILPLAGEIRPWQMTFIVVGAPGFIVVVLLSFLKEPARAGALTPTTQAAPTTQEYSLAEVVQHLQDNRRAYPDAPLRIILVVAALWLIPACLGPLAPSASQALRYSLLLLPLLICPAAVALLAWGLGAYRQTRQAVEAGE